MQGFSLVTPAKSCALSIQRMYKIYGAMKFSNWQHSLFAVLTGVFDS